MGHKKLSEDSSDTSSDTSSEAYYYHHLKNKKPLSNEAQLSKILSNTSPRSYSYSWNHDNINKQAYDIISKKGYVPTKSQFEELFKLFTSRKTKSFLGTSLEYMSFYSRGLVEYIFTNFKLTPAQFKICCGCFSDKSNLLWLDSALKTYEITNSDKKFLLNIGYGHYILNSSLKISQSDFNNMIKNNKTHIKLETIVKTLQKFRFYFLLLIHYHHNKYYNFPSYLQCFSQFQ